VDKNQVRIVCFDLGGVIIRTCRDWSQGCRAAGVPIRPAVESPEIEARIRPVDDLHQLGRLETSRFFQLMAEATGGLYEPDEVERVHDAWLLGEYEGTADLVQRLNSHDGLRTACLSNTNARHWDLMSGDGLRPGRFRAFQGLELRFASHLLGLAKPDPRIYRVFEERTGVSGDHIVFFDDRKENIETARVFGWKARQIDPLSAPARQMADHLSSIRVL
jgi:glucose-1-phosphatase